VQTVNKNLFDKVSGAEGRQLLRERQDHICLNPSLLDEFDAAGHPGNFHGLRSGAEERSGMPVKRHDRRGQTALFGNGIELADDFDVPNMNPIEFTDGDGARPKAGGDLIE
jgi:hypothetical protein